MLTVVVELETRLVLQVTVESANPEVGAHGSGTEVAMDGPIWPVVVEVWVV
jgi:hypothetical protein